MSATFERQKNTQAAVYTAGITGGLLLLFFLVTMSIPKTEVPVAEDFVEVNLGNGDVGSGNDQPLLPGDPAPAEQQTYTPPQPAPATETAVKDVTNDHETSNDAPVVSKPAVSKPDATKVAESKTVRTNNPTPTPVSNPAPSRPRAVMGRTMGGNGNGGNGADTYRPGTGEGVAGGNGDQGRPGGDPNGRNYSGTPRTIAARIISIPFRNYQNDFKEGGKIALLVSVDENGKLLSANYQQSGSSLPRSSKNYSIAVETAREHPWPKIEGGFKQSVTFVFKVN